ncbi:MAG TPA: PilZ domain-containing protein [Polyangiaceae bacterium]|nr:PilZ domain-containing protein [Polyangiaceae bacterium]
MGSNRSRSAFPPAVRAPLAIAPAHGARSSQGQAPRPTLAPFRAHARKAVRIPSTVTHTQAGWQGPAAVENIGLGGARIRVDSALEVGDVVTLSLTAPTLWDPLVLRGRVAWVTASAASRAAGIAFEHKATDAVFALYELIVTLGYDE